MVKQRVPGKREKNMSRRERSYWNIKLLTNHFVTLTSEGERERGLIKEQHKTGRRCEGFFFFRIRVDGQN